MVEHPPRGLAPPAFRPVSGSSAASRRAPGQAPGFSANQPRRTANRQTALSVISAMTAVVGASVRSFAADHSAT